MPVTEELTRLITTLPAFARENKDPEGDTVGDVARFAFMDGVERTGLALVGVGGGMTADDAMASLLEYADGICRAVDEGADEAPDASRRGK